jgi:hypothetical protein
MGESVAAVEAAGRSGAAPETAGPKRAALEPVGSKRAAEGPIRRGGSEWEVIKIFLEGDGGSNKMNTTSNARLRLATEVGQDHASTGVLLALGINNQPHRPENAAEHKPLALLTYTGQAGEHHRSDRFKPESPKTPSRPTELQTDPNSK